MHRRSETRHVDTTKMEISGGLLGKRVTPLKVSGRYSLLGNSNLVVPAASRRKSVMNHSGSRGIEMPAGVTLGEGQIATAAMSELDASILSRHAVIAGQRRVSSEIQVYRLDAASVPGPTYRGKLRDHNGDLRAPAQDVLIRSEKPERDGVAHLSEAMTTEGQVPGAPSDWLVDSSGSEEKAASTSARLERIAGVECAPGEQYLAGPTVRLSKVRRS